MKLNQARDEWYKLHEFDRRGYLSVFRCGKPTDYVSDEEAIKKYCNICYYYDTEIPLIVFILAFFLVFL